MLRGRNGYISAMRFRNDIGMGSILILEWFVIPRIGTSVRTINNI